MKIIETINKPWKALAAFSAFNVALTIASVIRTGNITYLFLVWNLFLAWVPFFMAYVWAQRLKDQKPLKSWKSIILAGTWLLFFPNAPYLVTDLIHLSGRFNPPNWSDPLLFFGMAMNGVVLGVYSLYYMHEASLKVFSKRTGWILVGLAAAACGFGVYLGRVQRWNSWDLLTQPYPLLKNAFLSLGNPLALKMTVGFSLLILIVYIVLKTIIQYESDQRKFE